MPASVCCTNCRTKYSLLNREEGCSSCALSFCKKCVAYRALIPNLSDKPLTVCYDCYKKLEEKKMKEQRNNVIITSTPLPPPQNIQSTSQNWWGDGLPPPSFRSSYNAPRPVPPSRKIRENQPQIIPEDVELEARRRELNKVPEPLSIEQIEQRLAELRGCDVEVIRNPRSYFENPKMDYDAKNPRDLMKIAEDRARIEEKEEEAERKDLDELEARRRKIFDKENEENNDDEDDDGNGNGNIRESVASEFSMATQDQMREIDDMLQDAEKKVADTKKQENIDSSELRELMAITRQKSLDAMQWNNKISKEIGGFWDRQNDKLKVEEDEDDEKSLDEETFKKIMYEAENTPDLPAETKQKDSQDVQESPKKRGFFNKFFKK
ncbi:unnamed protein product [Caenorhabditis angaria]|uniref:FYVE-type domain-containing protein n=1 Tax=Caenorhabditis angaria TaxID=860376 RepID=A0A9P1IUP9_9PELO|nr:unnamed protein product [Caenorhabditis angaria]